MGEQNGPNVVFLPSILHAVKIFDGTPCAVAHAPGATWVLVVAAEIVDDEEVVEEVIANVFGSGGLVVVFVPGAVYAVKDVAVYGGGVIRESMTLPSASVEASTLEGRISDAPVIDVEDAEVVIEGSDAAVDAK